MIQADVKYDETEENLNNEITDNNDRYDWFIPNVTRENAEDLLRNALVGTFVVRASSNSSNYAISFVGGNREVKHQLIYYFPAPTPPAGLYSFKNTPSPECLFPSLASLIKHCTTLFKLQKNEQSSSPISSPVLGIRNSNMESPVRTEIQNSSNSLQNSTDSSNDYPQTTVTLTNSANNSNVPITGSVPKTPTSTTHTKQVVLDSELALKLAKEEYEHFTVKQRMTTTAQKPMKKEIVIPSFTLPVQLPLPTLQNDNPSGNGYIIED